MFKDVLFSIPVVKTPDDEEIPIKLLSLEEKLLDHLNKLDFPPLEGDRISLKMRIFADTATKVINITNLFYQND